MGCGASRDAPPPLVAEQPEEQKPAPKEEEDGAEYEESLKVIFEGIKSQGPKAPALGPPDVCNEDKCTLLGDLPECLSDLHDGMPPTIQQAPMRLLKIKAVLTWKALKVFEEVDTAVEACEVPYMDTDDEMWKRVVTVSWRWAEQKPAVYQKGFSPMSDVQFQELAVLLRKAEERGLEFVWIDWACVPQYGEETMVEVHRSKVFYARARAMRVVPTFRPLPAEGPVRLILVKARKVLSKRATDGSIHCAVAAEIIAAILSKNLVAGREYFGRVWTLAERMARHGRGEGLCQWLSLESWLGMVVDAMLKSTEDKASSQIYKKMLGQSAAGLLEAVLEPLAAAVRTGSVQARAAEGLEVRVAELCKAAVGVWLSPSLLAEAPTSNWLHTYLGEEARSGVYQAWSEADRVWAIYSYFCWKSNLDQRSAEGLRIALEDLVEIAAGERKIYLCGMFAQLGIDEKQPVATPMRPLSALASNGGRAATPPKKEEARVSSARRRQEAEEAAAKAAAERRRQEEEAALSATERRRQEEVAAAAAAAERRKQEEAATAAAVERRKAEEAAAAAAANTRRQQEEAAAAAAAERRRQEAAASAAAAEVAKAKAATPAVVAAPPVATPSAIAAGKLVAIKFVPVADAQSAMSGHGGWADSMAKMLGGTGFVESIEKDGDVRIKMADGSGTMRWNPSLVVPMTAGTKVTVRGVPADQAKSLQSGHGGWADSMGKMLGKTGVIESLDKDKDVRVKMDDGSGTMLWNPAMLAMPSAGASAGGFRQGMKVLIKMVTIDEAKTAMNGHGGWANEMANMLGMTGTVESVDKDGDVQVKMNHDSNSKLWNPELLVPMTPGMKVGIRGISADDARKLQEGHGGWADSMGKMLGKPGVIESLDKDQDMRVKMDDGSGTMLWNPAMLCAPGLCTSTTATIEVGTKVQIRVMTVDEAKKAQGDHGGWNDNMGKCIGKTGVVTYKWTDGDVKVKMDDGTGEYCWNKASVVLAGAFEVGTKVQIRHMTVDQAKEGQKDHGGWNDGMAKCIGKTGVVTYKWADGDVKVKVDDGTGEYCWNKASVCLPVGCAAGAHCGVWRSSATKYWCSTATMTEGTLCTHGSDIIKAPHWSCCGSLKEK